MCIRDREETLKMLGIYQEVAEEYLAIPMVVGKKSEKEKFAGAFSTYTMEALMHDGKALQSGTSHNLGQHFTKAFDITFTGREGDIEYPYHTSWGISTRLIGGLIMVHSDDNGLVLPPKIAPIQVVIIPVAQHKEGVLDKAYEIKAELEKEYRVEIDDSEGYSPGWKFNQWEMKGVPIRLEIGPRDIANNQVVIARRDGEEKTPLPMENLEENIKKLLDDIQQSLFDKALKAREEKTFIAKDMEEFSNTIKDVYKRQPLDYGLICAYTAQYNTPKTGRIVFDMLTKNAARIFDPDMKYGIEVGNSADLNIIDAPNVQEALRLRASRKYVIKNGKVIARFERKATLL